MFPAEMLLWIARVMYPTGGLVAVPFYAEFEGPMADAVRTYYQGGDRRCALPGELFRLAFNAAVSSFSGRQQLYKRYYSGDPVRLGGALYLYDQDRDDLEAKSRGDSG